MTRDYVKIYNNGKIVGILPLRMIFYDVIKQEIFKPIKPFKSLPFIETSFVCNPYIPIDVLFPK